MTDSEYIAELEAYVCALAWHYQQAKKQGYTTQSTPEFEVFTEKAVNKMEPKIEASTIPIAEFSARFFGT